MTNEESFPMIVLFMTDSLKAISPLDGRYAHITADLRQYVSEYALHQFRIKIEVWYVEAVLPLVFPHVKITPQERKKLKEIGDHISEKDIERIKEIEVETKHDVKAVEYFLKEQFTKYGLSKYAVCIHLGLTSEDVNNLAYSMMLHACNKKIIEETLCSLLDEIKQKATQYKSSVMIARTHGQPAVPTTLGKEFANYYVRLEKLYAKLKEFRFEGKLNGAVGNYNAVQFTFPKVDWIAFSQKFITSCGLVPNLFTTQILPTDNYVEYFQILERINWVLVGFSQDMWHYIMLDLLSQKAEKKQVGSSTMPQKINPIDFENAEGNLILANSMFETFARKLLVSRLQRDLSDSTVKRTFGVAFGHMIVAWKSLVRGLHKVDANKEKMSDEVDAHWSVLAEAVQVYLRAQGNDYAYEKLRMLTQGKKFDKKKFQALIRSLSKDVYLRLKKLSPQNYNGLAEKLVDLITH